MHREHILVLEQLAKRAENATLRDFARQAVTGERRQLAAVETLAVPQVPEAKPSVK